MMQIAAKQPHRKIESRKFTLYLVVAYQWWLSQVDVHMAEMYSKNHAVNDM